MAAVVPTFETTKSYLGSDTIHSDDEIREALASELADQQVKLKIPKNEDGEFQYPQNLIEAAHRRVAHNLALRNLPLGLQAAISDGAASQVRVGGNDAEVNKLEGPYRKRKVG